MNTLFWILLSLLALYLIFRFLSLKMYEIKLIPHTETPEKFGLKFQEVRFPTENERTLYGWWIPAENSPETAATLILVHGWSHNLGRMLRYIQHLAPMNFNILAFDARHHGSSDPDDHSSMYKFGQDIQAAVKFACTQAIDREKVGVIGLSIGGAGSVYAAAQNDCIKAVITVGAPAHPVDVMKREFKRYHIPAPLRWLLLKQIELKIGVSYELFAPVNNIASATASFLIVHGEDDIVVLVSQGDKLYRAARPGQAEFWKIPGRGHSDCHHEPDFWKMVGTFLKSNLD